MKNWDQRHLVGLGSAVFSFQSQCRILEVRDESLLASNVLPTEHKWFLFLLCLAKWHQRWAKYSIRCIVKMKAMRNSSHFFQLPDSTLYGERQLPGNSPYAVKRLQWWLKWPDWLSSRNWPFSLLRLRLFLASNWSICFNLEKMNLI